MKQIILILVLLISNMSFANNGETSYFNYVRELTLDDKAQFTSVEDFRKLNTADRIKIIEELQISLEDLSNEFDPRKVKSGQRKSIITISDPITLYVAVFGMNSPMNKTKIIDQEKSSKNLGALSSTKPVSVVSILSFFSLLASENSSITPIKVNITESDLYLLRAQFDNLSNSVNELKNVYLEEL